MLLSSSDSWHNENIFCAANQDEGGYQLSYAYIYHCLLVVFSWIYNQYTLNND